MSLLAPRLQRGQETAFNAALGVLVAALNESGIGSPLLRGEYVQIKSTISVQEVRHSLGRIPVGMLVVSRPVGVDVGAASTAAWTKDRLYVESDVDDASVTLYVW